MKSILAMYFIKFYSYVTDCDMNCRALFVEKIVKITTLRLRSTELL